MWESVLRNIVNNCAENNANKVKKSHSGIAAAEFLVKFTDSSYSANAAFSAIISVNILSASAIPVLSKSANILS